MFESHFDHEKDEQLEWTKRGKYLFQSKLDPETYLVCCKYLILVKKVSTDGIIANQQWYSIHFVFPIYYHLSWPIYGCSCRSTFIPYMFKHHIFAVKI